MNVNLTTPLFHILWCWAYATRRMHWYQSTCKLYLNVFITFLTFANKYIIMKSQLYYRFPQFLQLLSIIFWLIGWTVRKIDVQECMRIYCKIFQRVCKKIISGIDFTVALKKKFGSASGLDYFDELKISWGE